MPDIKHKSFTYWIQHYDMTVPELERFIARNPFITPNIGQLPGPLRERVALGDIPLVTELFHECLAELVVMYDKYIAKRRIVGSINFGSVGALFGTPCIIEVSGKWQGAIARVCQISFPEIGAEYALKIFRRDRYFSSHGPWYEIPVAFRACRAEPRNFNRVHMASLGRVKYILSDWAGEYEGAHTFIRENKYEMFTTVDDEMHGGNYRHGRLIDYGRTYRTMYGSASYHARKIYRQLRVAARTADADTVTRIQRQYTGNAFLRRDFDAAVELIKQYAGVTYEIWISRVLGKVTR